METRQIVNLYPVQNFDGSVTYSTNELTGLGDPITAGVAIVSGVVSIVKAIKAGNAQRKQIISQRGEIEKAIPLLEKENNTLDDKIEELTRLLNQLSNLAINGLGRLCIIGCRVKKEAAKLNTAASKYDALSLDQVDKIARIEMLLSQIGELQAKLMSGNTIDVVKKVGIVAGAMLVTGVIIYTVTKPKKNKGI